MDKFDEMVEALEENEDMVECQECFELYPKADCMKFHMGYVCPNCGRGGMIYKSEGRPAEPKLSQFALTNDLFDQDFPEVSEYAPGTVKDWEAESTVMDALDALIADEIEAIDGYEEAEEIIEDSDHEDKEELLKTIEHIKEEEEEHIEELKDDCPECEVPTEAEVEEESDEVRGSDQKTESVHSASNTWSCVFKGKEIGTVEATSEEEALEKMQKEYPEYPYGECDGCFEVSLVEADCTKHKAITHSEDEKQQLSEEYELMFEQKLEEGPRKLFSKKMKSKAALKLDDIFFDGYIIRVTQSQTDGTRKEVRAGNTGKDSVYTSYSKAELKAKELSKAYGEMHRFEIVPLKMDYNKFAEQVGLEVTDAVEQILGFNAKFAYGTPLATFSAGKLLKGEKASTIIKSIDILKKQAGTTTSAEDTTPAEKPATETSVEKPASTDSSTPDVSEPTEAPKPSTEEPKTTAEAPEADSEAPKADKSDAADSEEPKTSTAPAASATDKDTTEPAEEKADDSASRNNTYFGHNVSDKAVVNFRKLILLTGIKVYDAFGKEVAHDAKALRNITPETLLDYEVEVRGKRTSVAKWLATAAKNKVIVEEFASDIIGSQALSNYINEDFVEQVDDDDKELMELFEEV